MIRVPAPAWNWLPICVATLRTFASATSAFTSCIVRVIGFCVKTGLFSLSAAIVATAWVWSGVETETASISLPIVASISR